MKPILTRAQKSSISLGVFWFAFLLVVMQLWLLTATMNAHLGGDQSVAWPAFAASIGCLLVNLWLLRRFTYLESDR
jgi:cytochrome b561